MAVLRIPDKNVKITDFEEIKKHLAQYQILHEQWHLDVQLSSAMDQNQILAAYKSYLDPFMQSGNYKTADVINVTPQTPDVHLLREKFLREHTHAEDEIRFFIDGQGLFWFNVEGEVISLLCTAGDLISVPAGYPHWFDLGDEPYVKAIRIFTNPEGWVAQYTNSGIDEKYNPKLR